MRGLAALLLVPSLHSAETAPPVLTVCDVMSNLGKYDGKTAIVVGRLSSTFEGAWLTQECGSKVANAAREFGSSISLAYVVQWFKPAPPLPPDFVWDRGIIEQKLVDVKRTTRVNRKLKDRWFACFGRLETRLPYDVNIDGKAVEMHGYGHMGGSPAQLIAPEKGYLQLKR